MNRRNYRTPYYYDVIRKAKRPALRNHDVIAKIKAVVKPPELYDISVRALRDKLMVSYSQYSVEIKNTSDEILNECLKRCVYESKK